MDGKSVDIAQQKLEQLKQVLPEAFSEGNLDLEKLRLAIGEDIAIQNERYVLNWAGKGDAFRALQTPTTATLAPAREESVNFDETENIFIEGENLEVLKVLQKAYYGKVKMIYIDPPYNTGSDSFVYPDKFSESREDYLKRIEAKDEEGYVLKEGQFRENSKDSGHYHSNWLSMMYPRLFLARNLLREDGVIFVSIDDNEVHNLRLLMNDIFGEDNFIGNFIWQSRTSISNDRPISLNHNHTIVFAKDFHNLKFSGLPLDHSEYKNPDNDPRGPWKLIPLDANKPGGNTLYPIENPNTGEEYFPPNGRSWSINPEDYQKLFDDGRIAFGITGEAAPKKKLFLEEREEKGDTKTPSSLLLDFGTTQNGTDEIMELFEGKKVFSYPKPTTFLQALIQFGANDDDALILDFFSGSSTTAHSTFHQNISDNGRRKFLLIQFPEKVDTSKEEGRNAQSFGLNNIAEIGKERIRRAIQRLKEQGSLSGHKNQDLGFRVFKLKHSNFKLWRGDSITDSDQLEEQLDLLADPVMEAAQEENLLTELLLKSGFELTTPVEKKTVGDTHYWLAKDEEGNSMAVALRAMDETLLREMITQGPQQLICLDRLFTSDQLKTNIQLQCKDAGIVFHAI